MLKSLLIGAACCVLSLSAVAQENLVGKWSGSYEFTGSTRGKQTIGVELEITKVDDNGVTGTFNNLSNRGCSGEFPMAGKLEGGELRMISTKSGGAQSDCKLGFRVKVDGNRMTGKMGQYDIQMNKK